MKTKQNFYPSIITMSESVDLAVFIGHKPSRPQPVLTQLKTYLQCHKPFLYHMKIGTIKFGLYDFYQYDFEVNQIASNDCNQKNVSIKDACQNLKRKTRSPVCYSLPLTGDNFSKDPFEIPLELRKYSLFLNYWPRKQYSRYFKYRNKIISAYQDDYTSHAYRAYGGLSEWIFVLEGTLKVTLFSPSRVNSIRYSTLGPNEEFQAEDGTLHTYNLREGALFIIPPGYISVRKAKRTTHTFSGEFLHDQNIKSQLEAFELDVIQANNSFCFERDSEIRTLYWFLAANLASTDVRSCKTSSSNQEENKYSDETIDCFRKHLLDWRTSEKKSSLGVFIPMGIQYDLILRDLDRNRPERSKSTPRKSIKLEPSQSPSSDEKTTQ